MGSHPLTEPNQGFGPLKRLRTGDFQRVLREGISLQAQWFTLKAFPAGGERSARFGCTIRRSAYLPGVTRNRVKRWFREAFRLHQGEFPQGCDILVVVKARPERESFFLVEKTLLSVASQLRRHPSF